MSGLSNFWKSLMGPRPAFVQVGALCLRGDKGHREVLLVSSLRTGRWIIPKGWPMKDKSLAQSAEQEAWEEAGVQGEIERQPMGKYTYLKDRGKRLGVFCEVHIFEIKDVTLSDDFPEAGRRELRWVPLIEAAELVNEPELQEILKFL
jgi:8-oxo-dGTP pyrophosphatase MutT (NUDIX family)